MSSRFLWAWRGRLLAVAAPPQQTSASAVPLEADCAHNTTARETREVWLAMPSPNSLHVAPGRRVPPARGPATPRQPPTPRGVDMRRLRADQLDGAHEVPLLRRDDRVFLLVP